MIGKSIRLPFSFSQGGISLAKFLGEGLNCRSDGNLTHSLSCFLKRKGETQRKKIFWVKNKNLDEVNTWLQKGGRVKMIVAVPESVSEGGESSATAEGNIFAYVVVEFD